VPVGVDADSLGRASELLTHDWSGNGIEGQSDDVQEVGGFLGPAAVPPDRRQPLGPGTAA